MKPIFIFISFFLLRNIVAAQQDIAITLKPFDKNDPAIPVEVTLPRPLPISLNYQLKNTVSGTTIPAQLRDSMHLVFIRDASLAGAVEKKWIVERLNKKNRNPPVRMIKTDSGIQVSIKGKPLLFYHTSESLPPPDSPSYYKRSGFIHPLYSPNGNILTDDFPAGHAHQHGIFYTWTNNTFRNEPLDFWNQHLQQGTVQHVKILSVTEGEVFSQFKAELAHKSLKEGTVLKEIWTVTVYPLTKYFLFDLRSEQVNITKDTLFLNKYHYGGLAFRGSRMWNPDDHAHYKSAWKILTSEGKTLSNADQSHAGWVDVSGVLEHGSAGVTIFSDPGNFRYPQALRVHPDMPYWCFTPVLDGPFFMAPGVPYRSVYRYYVHAGPADKKIIKQLTVDK